MIATTRRSFHSAPSAATRGPHPPRRGETRIWPRTRTETLNHALLRVVAAILQGDAHQHFFRLPKFCSSISPKPNSFALARMSARLAGPDFERSSMRLPPLKSMPTFMPTKTNSAKAKIDIRAEKGSSRAGSA